jgi:zinc transport system substrate-binding protein
MFFSKIIFLVLFLVLSQVHASNKVWAEPIPVFVSIVPQKYFVERIGGDQVSVEVMVKPGESPATFNPNPKKMSLLSQAKLYFSIGVPFERIWLGRIQSMQPGLQFVPLHDSSHERLETDHGHDHHSHASHDPHIWTSPAKVKIMAQKIKDAMTRTQPQKEKYFHDNLQAFLRDLDKLDGEIRAIIAGSTHRRFMVFHPAWSYFASDYGLEQVSIQEGGKEPGPRALQAIIEKGKKLGIKVIFVQKQFSLSIANKIARVMGATVREMDPLAEDYIENMRRTAKAISGALQ